MKTTTASDDPGAFARLRELVREIDIAMLTTVTPDGALHSRPMITRDFDEDGRLWFFAADDSGMVKDLEAEQGVNVSYADSQKRRYVSVTGNADVEHDRKQAEKLWHPTLQRYFPHGLHDPSLVVLRVRISSAEFWDSPTARSAPQATSATGREDHVKVEIRAARESG